MTREINVLADMPMIDLTAEPPFTIAGVTIRPSVRQVVDRTGRSEVIEPRVMQVLVALAQARGDIVTRTTLTDRCWEGRIVGEDAINRVISRLRRLAEGPGAGAFRIETVTKVGYRLVTFDTDGAAAAMPAAEAPLPNPQRRAFIAAGLALGGGVAAAGTWWLTRPSAPPPAPASAVALAQQALFAMRQVTPDGISQAIGLSRRVVQVAPDYADGWGTLAMAYAGASHGRAPRYTASMKERAIVAANRAFALDPRNALATGAIAATLPTRGAWLEAERVFRNGLDRHPQSDVLLFGLSRTLLAVGRCRESALLVDQAVAVAEPSPVFLYAHFHTLWAADRLEEADAAMDRAFALYPLHFAVWFARFYMLMYTGRVDQALAFGNDVEGRPRGIPDRNFDIIMAVAKAMETREPADIDRAIAVNMLAARDGAGFAENTMQFASVLGRLDDAFSVADATFFGRGFDVGVMRFSAQQGGYTALADRRTYVLFQPSTRAMRADRRFEPLVRELGLVDHWARSGKPPDYLGATG